MDLPRNIMERVERLYAYHQRSKHAPMGPRLGAPADPAYRPAAFRVFTNHHKVPLPTSVLEAPVGVIHLLSAGQDVLPDSLRAPPQDLKTLASWLYYAAGESRRGGGGGANKGGGGAWTRPFAEAEAMLPVEIYVAVFAVKDIDPGLYHFCPREFALRKLREGVDTLLQIKKGRPDLEFLKTLPAVVLVAANYWRAVWRYGRRGYRTMLLDVGQMTQNLVVAGAGLGAQTVTRLRMNDSTTRELIGMPDDEPLGTAEAVCAMVAWADAAVEPLRVPPGRTAGPMPPITRAALSEKVTEDAAVDEPLLVHQDCVAPGMAVRELRPPLTELSPLPANLPRRAMPLEGEPEPGLAATQVLLARRPRVALAEQPIARDAFLTINRVAFRGGSFFPMFPDGPHVACVRPFWILHDVAGVDRGIWFYNPITDGWSPLSRGRFRREAKYLAGDKPPFAGAAAVCVMTANLYQLMTQGGPDAYRLAHLEAGVCAQRLYLAATSLGLGAATSHDFYDDDCRAFFGLGKTGWEPLYCVAIGRIATAVPASPAGRKT